MRSVDEDSKTVISFHNGSVVLIFYYFPINVCTVNFRVCFFFLIRECFCANRFDCAINIALQFLPSATVVVERLCFHRCLFVHGGRCTPPDRYPLGRHPHGQTPPGQAPWADTPQSDGHCSRWYASYWYAFLSTNLCAHSSWQKSTNSSFSTLNLTTNSVNSF